MTTKQAIQILNKIGTCNDAICSKKTCVRCEYYVTWKKKREAIDVLIKIAKQQPGIKTEFFKSGIEFAKQEMICKLEQEKGNVADLHKAKEINDLIYTQVLGLQKAIEIVEEVKLDEGIKENNREGG